MLGEVLAPKESWPPKILDSTTGREKTSSLRLATILPSQQASSSTNYISDEGGIMIYFSSITELRFRIFQKKSTFINYLILHKTSHYPLIPHSPLFSHFFFFYGTRVPNGIVGLNFILQ